MSEQNSMYSKTGSIDYGSMDRSVKVAGCVREEASDYGNTVRNVLSGSRRVVKLGYGTK